jgi:hypothetical protein
MVQIGSVVVSEHPNCGRASTSGHTAAMLCLAERFSRAEIAKGRGSMKDSSGS